MKDIYKDNIRNKWVVTIPFHKDRPLYIGRFNNFVEAKEMRTYLNRFILYYMIEGVKNGL